jgi:hypothetical protein
MKPFFALVLCGLVAANWLQGFNLCRTLAGQCDTQVLAKKSEVESTLEFALHEDQAVKIVDRTFNGRRGWAYPGDFVYFAQINGDTARFILKNDADDLTEKWKVVHLPESSDENPIRPVSTLEIFHPYIFNKFSHIHCLIDTYVNKSIVVPFYLQGADANCAAFKHPPEETYPYA